MLCLLCLLASAPVAGPAPSYTNAIGMELVLIPAGSFVMGTSPGDEPLIDPHRKFKSDKDEDTLRTEGVPSDEVPAHRVTITRPFYLGKYEVTQEEWERVMGSNPSRFKGPRNPVDTVTWFDAQAFIDKLNAREGGRRYRLPTEAEWEYAARAGSKGARPGNIDAISWCAINSGTRTTHPVGTKAANAFGVHDMLGNVWEWVADWYRPDYYAHSPEKDPKGPETSSRNVRSIRGASAQECYRQRAADRGKHEPEGKADVAGFRVARSID